MATQRIAQSIDSNFSHDNKLYLERARVALPYLVRQAKAGQTIYYSDLATEINMLNPRNLNYVLGSIGNTLIELGKRTNREIPPIQCLVINKRNELPGEGVDWFIMPMNSFELGKLTKTQKKKIVHAELIRIYTFQHWDWVLRELGLNQIDNDISNILKKAKSKNGNGESEQHKEFKKFVSVNPQLLGLGNKLNDGEQEYILPSTDRIDILFSNKGLKIGVEVKSIISDTADILRGLFQCIKYKYLLEAEQIVNNSDPNCRVMLVLQGKFPDELMVTKNLLGIEVIDKIEIKIKQ